MLLFFAFFKESLGIQVGVMTVRKVAICKRGIPVLLVAMVHGFAFLVCLHSLCGLLAVLVFFVWFAACVAVLYVLCASSDYTCILTQLFIFICMVQFMSFQAVAITASLL